MAKRPTKIFVELRKGESFERMMRRFLKKCKKENIVEEYREKYPGSAVYEKPSQKRRTKREKARRLREAEARKQARRRNKKRR